MFTCPWDVREHATLGAYALKWLTIAALMSAAILIALEWATNPRHAQPWLLYLLPVSGLLVALLYHYCGNSAEGGNNLVVDEIPPAASDGRGRQTSFEDYKKLEKKTVVVDRILDRDDAMRIISEAITLHSANAARLVSMR